MKYWVILGFSLALFITRSSAQNEYVNWYFGTYVGLNFCNGLHISDVNQFPLDYAASATMSDKNTGKMLFHSDGQTVWNSQFGIMQNGSGLNGSNESAQGALIVPQPGNDSIFYIFTTGSEGPNPQDGLQYSIVNMNLNDGLGAVISKNNFLHKSLEKLTAVFNKTENFFWILAVDSASNNFLEYKLDARGLNTTPMFYPTNVIFSSITMSSGFLKVSPNANLLACTFELPDTSSLYNFNNNTGKITFITKLQFLIDDDDVWGISFSPNSSKLYVRITNDTIIFPPNNYQTNDKIYQFDVTSGNPITIRNSRIKVFSYNATNNDHLFGTLQLGPDRKLYIARIAVDSLCVIDDPDGAGLACNFRFNAISLNGLYSAYSLSNNIDNLYEWAQSPSLNVTASSQGCTGIENISITASKNYNNYQITFGDSTNILLDSLHFTGSHQYTSPGNYRITVKGFLGCMYDSVSTIISIPACMPQLIIPTLIYGRGSQTQWHIINLPQGNNSVIIYDELGRTLYKTSNYPNNYDMRNLPPAMYFYRLTLGSGQEYTGKIVLVK